MEKRLAAQFSLTDEECEILRYVVQGYSHREIADRLGFAVGTIHRKVPRTRRKLGVHSRRQVLALLWDQFPGVLEEWGLGAVWLYEQRGRVTAGAAPPVSGAPQQVRAGRKLRGSGGLLANLRWEWDVAGKRTARQGPAEPAGCRLRVAIPKAGRDRAAGRRGVAEEGAGQQRELGQALAGLRGVDELALGAEVALERQRAGGREWEGRGQQERVTVARWIASTEKVGLPAGASGRARSRQTSARSVCRPSVQKTSSSGEVAG